jgi:hypothetical protein
MAVVKEELLVDVIPLVLGARRPKALEQEIINELII